MDTIWTELLGLDLRQSYYVANGVRTRAIEAGQGPPLIFLHGTGGHSEAYVKNIASHAKHFHVYAIDMVGHGYSDRPDLSYGVPDFVNHVHDFLDCIEAEKAFISGESLGGITAAWLAIRYPDRVEKLVLNTGILMPLDEQGNKEIKDLIDRARGATSQLTRESVKRRLQWLMLDPNDVTDELVEVRYRIYSQPGRSDTMRTIAESILGGVIDPVQSKDWLASNRLRDIKCPTLVLWTRHNPGQSVALAEKACSLIPHAKLVILENSAHWPQWEESDLFNETHLKFLLQP